MAHLVRDVVNPESIAGRWIDTRFAKGLAARDAGDADPGHAAAGCAENVADVVIGVADDKIEIGLVLRQQQTGVVAGVRIRAGVGVDEQVVFGDEDEANPGFGFVNAADPIDCRNDRGESARNCAAEELRVFTGCSAGESISAQGVVAYDELLEAGFTSADGFTSREARKVAFGSTIIAFVVAGIEVGAGTRVRIDINSAVGRKDLGMEAGGD